MPLFADEPFWKVPNVHEAGGAVGLLLAIFSIWLSWWLATRDTRRRIEEAQRGTNRYIERLLTTHVQAELAEVIRCLRAVRAAADERRWTVAVVRIDDAEQHLARVQQSRRFAPDEQDALEFALDGVYQTAATLRRVATTAGDRPLAKPAADRLNLLIRSLTRIDAGLHARITETPDG